MSNEGQFDNYCRLPIVLQNLQREHEKVNESLATANQKTLEQSKGLETLSNQSADLAKQLEESTTEAKTEKEALKAGDNILAMQS